MKKSLFIAITVSCIIVIQTLAIANDSDNCGQVSNSFTQLSDNIQLASKNYSSSNSASSCNQISNDLEIIYIDKLLVANKRIKLLKKEANIIISLVQRNLKSDLSPKSAKEFGQLKKDLKEKLNIFCHEVEKNSIFPHLGDELSFRLKCVDRNRLLFTLDWTRDLQFPNIKSGGLELFINDEIVTSGDERFSVNLSIQKEIKGRYKFSFSTEDLENSNVAILGVVSQTGKKTSRYNYAFVEQGVERFYRPVDFSANYNKGFKDFISAYYPDCSGHLELDRKLGSFDDLKDLKRQIKHNNQIP